MCFEFRIRRSFGLQADLQDIHVRRREFHNVQTQNLGGQVAANRVYFADNVLIFHIGFRFVLKFDANDRQPVVNPRDDALDIVEFVAAFFDGFDDELLHICRRSAGINDDDSELRRGKIRVFAARHIEQRIQANCQQRGEDDERKLVVFDGKFRDFHFGKGFFNRHRFHGLTRILKKNSFQSVLIRVNP